MADHKKPRRTKGKAFDNVAVQETNHGSDHRFPNFSKTRKSGRRMQRLRPPRR